MITYQEYVKLCERLGKGEHLSELEMTQWRNYEAHLQAQKYQGNEND